MIRKRNDGTTEIALINIFESINGEAYASGKPAVFIRTFGCNLRCKFPCDTQECWSVENLLKVYPERKDWKEPFKWMSAKEIFNEVESIEKNYYHKSICLTGGEPLMEDDKEFMIKELIPLFVDAHYDVGIETDGGIDYADYKKTFGDSRIINERGDREGVTIIADYKLPCSGMTSLMVQSNLDIYASSDVIKMVISDNEADWQELERIINSGTKATIFISPCFGKVTMNRLPEFVIKHSDKPIQAQIQSHKIFWDSKEKDV